MLMHSANKVIVTGDFNARNTVWNCYNNNKSGKILLDLSFNKNFTVLSPKEPTYIPSTNQMRPSVIDHVLCKQFPYITKPISLTCLSSDHNPIYFEINKAFKQVPEKYVYDFRHADWNNYRNYINNTLKIPARPHSHNEINNSVTFLNNVILRSSQLHIPQKVLDTNHIPIPHSIKMLIKIKNLFRKQYQKYKTTRLKTILNFLTRLVKNKLLEHRNDVWNNKLKSLSTKDKSLWNITKNFSHVHANIPPITHNNIIAYSDKDKVEFLAQHYYQVHNQNTTLSAISHTKKVDRTVRKYCSAPPTPDSLIKLATPKEISYFIKRLKCKSSTGQDLIHTLMVKNLPKIAIVYLTNIINAIIITGHYPKTWKTSTVIPIPKVGKDSSLAKNIRPISLISNISKITEKVILQRLKSFSDEHNIINETQFGFRPQLSTVMQLARLTDHILDQFNLNKHT